MPDENDTSGSLELATGVRFPNRADPVSVQDARNGRVCAVCNAWAPGRMVVNKGGRWYCKDHAPVFSDSAWGETLGKHMSNLRRPFEE